MMFEQRFGLRTAPSPVDPPNSKVEIREEAEGVFVASCQRCGHVVGVHRTRTEVERDKAAHVCGQKPEGSPLLRYLTLT